MKFKKILSGVLASAMLISAMPAFSSVAVDKDATGNTMLDAVEIKFGEIVSEKVDEKDHDWYKFTLPSVGKVTVTVSGKIGYALLSGNDEGTKYEDTHWYENGTRIFSYYLAAGDYYIDISSASMTTESSDLQVRFTPCDVTFEDADNNTLFNAAPVEYDGTIYKGVFLNDDPVDYYTFNVAEQGRVTLKFTSPMDNVDWEIYDSDDTRIKKGAFSKDEQDTYISGKDANIMKPGKYTIAFKKKDSYGEYSFSLDYLKNYNDTSVSGIIAAADIDGDGAITSADASLVLAYYAYISTGGTETDMNKWLASKK